MVKFSLSSSILLSLLSILITSILNFEGLLASILFGFSPGDFSCSFGACLSLHFGCLCVYFYIVSVSAMSPGLVRVASQSRYLVRPSGAVSLIAWFGFSRCAPCVNCVCPPVVFESWLLWPVSAGFDPQVGWLWRLAPNTSHKLLCSDWPQRVGYVLVRSVTAETSLWVCLLWRCLDGVLLWSVVGHLVCWFGASLECLWYSPISDAACGRPGATC